MPPRGTETTDPRDGAAAPGGSGGSPPERGGPDPADHRAERGGPDPADHRAESGGPDAVAEGGEHGERALSREDKVRLGLLALPTFALALAITIVSTYLSEVTRRYTHQTAIIGAIVGGEGVMALWIPLIAGPWSDRLRTRIGGRLPFVLAGGLPAAAAVALIGFVHGLALVAAMAGVFFAFYFVAYEPYRAMYPDLVEAEEVAGRAQSTQALARGIGTGCALLGGGLLLSVARPLPFAVAAFVLAAATAGFVILVLRRGLVGRSERRSGEESAGRHSGSGDDASGARGERRGSDPAHHVARQILALLRRHPAMRAYFVANALWEMALAAMKAFVILYITIGLGYSLRTGALLIGAVALVILIGAGASGKAGDRWGRIRVVQFALVAYGVGYLIPIFTTSRPVLAVAMPFLAIGGGTIMTMAYAILMPLMPEHEHGALTGFYSLSRGVGIVSGPILAGVAIYLTRHSVFPGTHGFQAMWIVCAGAALLSLPFVVRLRREVNDREELEAAA